MRWGKRLDRRRVAASLPPLDPLPHAGGTPAFVRDRPLIDDAAALPDPSREPAQLQPGWGTASVGEHSGAGYPTAAYDRFRRDIPIRPPPGPLPVSAEGALAVLIDASLAAPFLLRATLRSLQDQSVRCWRGIVIGPAALGDHPVGGFAQTDARISFVTDHRSAIGADHVALLTAGVVLDPEALAWLLFAAARTRAAAVFADHDDGIADPRGRLVRTDPYLPGALDTATLDAQVPALVLATGIAWHAARDEAEPDGGDGLRRAVLKGALADGGVPHVARLLATRMHLPVVARDGRASEDDSIDGRLGPLRAATHIEASVPEREERIAVVIPTRDAAGLLARAIESLTRTARDPARLHFVVVDNRSGDDPTRRLLDALSAAGTARIVRFDAPFNWSQASNLGAAASDAPVIAFANNDIEMTSTGWDDRLLNQLADPRVGAVGARLLYPDGTIQHAGVAFGFGPNGAEHEGRGRDMGDEGPNRRFAITHAVASVTGAFLGVRRAEFDALGGFDADRLMIGHSDVDFCLRLRERGLIVRYCAAIEALHHEGASRGRNETRAAIAWDEGERADLIDRWGDELMEDPSINPHWTRGGQVFDGFSEPRLSEIVRHIDITARADPWRPARRTAREEAAWLPDALG